MSTTQRGGPVRGPGPSDGVLPFVATRPYPLGPAPDPRGPARTPVHDPGRCDGGGACERACPTQAISLVGAGKGARLTLDYGACVFCRSCVEACPSGAMNAVDVFELAVTRRQDLVVDHVAGVRGFVGPTPSEVRTGVRTKVQRLFGGALAVREVDAGSCNGCEVEVGALSWPAYDLERLGIHLVASPRHADALLVTGPVTANMRLALEKTYRATPAPKLVIAVGACGISGGPFRGSPAVGNGVGGSIPVDVWVPGCPPRPEALLYGFWVALGKAEARLRGGELAPSRGSGGRGP